MAQRLLACISPAGASVALWKGRLTNLVRFGPDEQGHADFAAFVRRLRSLPMYIAVDTVEEDYRVETLPHAGGRDRREMIERRLKQLYRTTPYYAGVLQARETEQARKDDRYLFAAVTDAELLQPWLAPVEALKVPLAGIYPVPTVSAAVARLLKLKLPNLLVVSKHAAGMRQTFMRNGTFRFSRLTPFRGLAETNRDAAFANEVGNTRMYLNAMQVTAADEIVQVLVLDQDDTLAGLHAALNASPAAIRVERYTRRDLETRMKIAPGALTASPDALPLHLLGVAPPNENLAPMPLRQSYQSYLAGRAMFAAGGVAAVVAAAWFGYDTYRVRQMDEEAAGLAIQAERYQALYAELTRQFPTAPVSAATLKQTVDAFDRVRERARTPETLYRVVSDALESQPQLVLTSIVWKHGRLAEGGTASSPGSAGRASEGPIRQTGVLDGELSEFSGDYRAAIGTIREFAERLRRDPRVAEARIVRLPLDESSRQSLSGSTAKSTERLQNAQFQISVTLRDEGGA